MKKIIFLIFFLIVIINIPKEDKMVFNEIINTDHYELDFKEENLNIGNFKLKMATFTSYEYYIKRVYIKDKYISFNNESFNIGIEKLKEEYIQILKDNHMYNELDKDINMTKIDKVEIYTQKAALNKFKEKYPKVIINILEN